jgi:hypothetical protein
VRDGEKRAHGVPERHLARWRLATGFPLSSFSNFFARMSPDLGPNVSRYAKALTIVLSGPLSVTTTCISPRYLCVLVVLWTTFEAFEKEPPLVSFHGRRGSLGMADELRLRVHEALETLAEYGLRNVNH